MNAIIAEQCGETPVGDIAVASIFIVGLLLVGFICWLATRS